MTVETIQHAEPAKIAVCRTGPRGWHWIRLQDFDPARHVVYPPIDTQIPEPQPAKPATAVKAKVGRPRKHTPMERSNVYR